MNLEASLFLYKYNSVKFHQLTRQEACRCAWSFISSVNTALSDLHNTGFAHNDVQLENICFFENYEAVLIDLDRATPLSSRSYLFNKLMDSCMYKLKSSLIQGNQTDLFQLDSNFDYHNREWDECDCRFKKDLFIQSLIINGLYNSDHLLVSEIVMDLDTLENILCARLQQWGVVQDT